VAPVARVTLRDITRKNWRDALALEVEPDQLRFGFANTGALLFGEPCYRLSLGKLARRADASL